MRTLLMLSVLALFLSSCAAYIFTPATTFSYLYSDVRGPINAVGSGEITKTGEACATNILGLIATGDASIDAAMRNGGIKEPVTVDYKVMGVLGIFAQYCTIVKGR